MGYLPMLAQQQNFRIKRGLRFGEKKNRIGTEVLSLKSSSKSKLIAEEDF